MNLLGMFLSFTATSQLAVTVTFAALTILLVIGVGFLKNGLGFFKLFWPAARLWCCALSSARSSSCPSCCVR